MKRAEKTDRRGARICHLTANVELTCPLRRGAQGRLATMYSVPPARPARHAVAGPVESRVMPVLRPEAYQRLLAAHRVRRRGAGPYSAARSGSAGTQCYT